MICCYLLLTRYRCPKNPFYLPVCGGRRVNVFRSSHGYHVTGLSTFESARTYTYREIQSRKKYCIYHIWVFISSCFNNHFINNFPFRLVQKFWEMVISCSYAFSIFTSYKPYVTSKDNVYLRWVCGSLSISYYLLLTPLPLSENMFKLFDNRTKI